MQNGHDVRRDGVATSRVGEEGAIVVSVRHAAALMSISERTMWELIKRGEIPTVRLGHRVLVARADLEALAAASARHTPPTECGANKHA